MKSAKLLLITLVFVTLSSPTHAGIIINEIMQNPSAVSDSNGEWFELYNTSDTAVNIDGWIIQDNGSNSHTINYGSSLMIDAHSFLVLGNNADTSNNGHINIAYEYDGFSLGNSDDELILFNNLMIEIDRVEWDNGVTFPDPNGASMAFVSTSADNNIGSNWRQSLNSLVSGDFATPGNCNTDVGQVCISTTTEKIPEPSLFALLPLALLMLTRRRSK